MNRDRNYHNTHLPFQAQLIVVILLLLSILLSSCGKNKAVEDTELLILDIGDVTLESGEAIDNAYASYDALSDKEKAEVRNYDKLAAAKEKYDELLKTDITGTWCASFLGFDMTYCFYPDGTYENFMNSSAFQNTSGTYTYDGERIKTNTGRDIPAKKVNYNTLIMTSEGVDITYTKQ